MNVTRKCLVAGLAAATFASASAQAQQPSVMGTWLTQAGNAHIELAPCADPARGPVCGTIVALPKPAGPDGRPVAAEEAVDFRNPDASLRGRKVLGMVMLWGFKKASAPNAFEEGRIYSGADGKTYTANIGLADNGTLRLRGYVGTPLFGETQVWARVR